MMIEKARSSERARIEALLAREEARMRRAFRRFLDDVKSDPVLRQIRIALEDGGIEAALRVIDAHVARMGPVVAQMFQATGQAEVEALAAKLGNALTALSFDPTYPRAAALMRTNTLEFVREMTRAQREATRAALVEALQTGAGPAETARLLRDSIGLTEYQRRAVANYRALLEAGDAAALARDLRDRRFDSSVRRAAEDDEPLGADKIDRMVEQYQNRFLQYRGENIARTEAQRTVGEARRESLGQVLEQIGEPRSAVRRTWVTTEDGRERDTHSEMDGQQRGIDEPYESPSGARLMFPGDSSLGAPASEVVNCRCTEMFDVVPSDEAQR